MKIRIGTILGIDGGADPGAFSEAVAAMESLGFDSLWLAELTSRPTPDPIVGLTFAAARTTRLKLGTGVLVLPGRNPAVVAKQLASLDWLSGGRLLVAFGLGLPDPAEAAEGRRIIEAEGERAGRRIDPEHFGATLSYGEGEIPEILLASIARRRPGIDPGTLVPKGLDGIRQRLEEFIAVGFSKFVV